MARSGMFPDSEMTTKSLVRLYFPQRKFDYPSAFKHLGIEALGATMNGTKEGTESLSLENKLYLSWRHPYNPARGFLVYWDLNFDQLIGFNLDINSPRYSTDQRCNLCLVQQRVKQVQAGQETQIMGSVTFRNRMNSDISVTHIMCAALNCEQMARGEKPPLITTGYSEYPPTQDLISHREANIMMQLHAIGETLIGDKISPEA